MMTSEEFNAAQVHVGCQIVDAMRALEDGSIGVALVVDDDHHLVGTATDGDIRRAILNGCTLESPIAPHIQRNFTFVSPAAGRAEVLDLMQARTLKQIPVLGPSGGLLGVHLLHDVLGAVQRSNWAVIMAGGRGTRLRPLTETLPKPMARVAGRPILERIVLHLVGSGLKRLFISIGYLGHVIESHFGDGSRYGCQIDYLREDVHAPLGTGGPLSLLPKPPQEPVCVMNGDLVTEVDIGRMIEAHSATNAHITVGARRYCHQVPFGCLEMERGVVRRIDEKPLLERHINAGVYILSPEAVSRVPHRFFPITELLEDALSRGANVSAFEIGGDWIDVGQWDALRVAREGAI